MTTAIRNHPDSLLTRFYKYLTLTLFFVLPSRVATIFVSLSVLALIYDIKKISIKDKKYDQEKLNKLLNLSFNEEIMILPSYTVHWFWKDELLEKEIRIDDQVMKFKDVVKDDDVLFKHLRLITDELLNNIPKCLKFKLNLNETKQRLIVKHNVMNVLLYG